MMQTIYIHYIQGDKKCIAHRMEGESTLQKKYDMNIGLLKHDF